MTQREYLRVLGPFVLTTMTQPLLGAVDTAVMGRPGSVLYCGRGRGSRDF